MIMSLTEPCQILFDFANPVIDNSMGLAESDFGVTCRL